MGKKKHRAKCKKCKYDRIIPPCSKYLGNDVPFLKDCKFIYDNQNRIYAFIRTTPKNLASLKTTLNTNLQISLTNFFIGYYISQIQRNLAYYDENVPIHSDKRINQLIHNTLKAYSKIQLPFPTFLSLFVSNSNAIAPLVHFSTDITSLNYLILLCLHTIERNPGLFYGNNNYITNNILNLELASQELALPFYKL